MTVVTREVVADGMETILKDGKVVEFMADVKQKDHAAWEKIKGWFKNLAKFLQKMVDAYKGQSAQTIEGAKVAEFSEDLLNQIKQIWGEGAVAAGENYQTAEVKENTTENGGVKQQSRMTEADIKAVQGIGRISVNQFSTADIKATERFARQYWKEMGAKSPFFRAWFGDWRINDQTKVQIANKKGDTRGVQKNDDTGWNVQVSGQVFAESKHFAKKNKSAMPYLPYINDIVEKAILLDSYGIEVGKAKSQNSLLMHSLYAIADVGHGPELLKLYVEEMNDPNSVDTSKRAYQLQNIEKASAVNGGVQGNSPSSLANTTNAIRTVADLFAAVKQKDADFNPNSASKVVNADGTPKVMYHGSRAQFTIFDRSKAKSGGHYGRGFYFTDSTSHAGTYGNQYSVYLDIRNPLQSGGEVVSRSQVRKFLEAVAENEDYSIENYGTYDVDAILDNVMGQFQTADAFKIIQDINVTAIGDMVEAAELFNDVNGTEFDGVVVPTETVAFYPEQIKSATDNIGTFDGSNPDIRFSDREELTPSEYNRLTTKKPIKVSSQEWAMIRAQRKTKYGSLDEYDIPVIDFFRIGDYRIINNGFVYYIRNSGPDDFSVVMRKQIAPDVRRITREVIKDENRRNNAAIDPSTGQEGSKRGSDRSSGERAGNGRELSENDRGTFQGGEPQRDLHAGQGDADSGTVKRSDRDSDFISNRALLANALEGVAQNDMERNKIAEYKEKIGQLDAQEKKLRELNAQIKEMSFAKGPRDTKKIRELRDEAIMTTNRIGIYDKQLLRLEASAPLQKVLEREKSKAYKRAEKKGKEALEEYKAKAEAQQKETAEKWRESRKKAVEGRVKTEGEIRRENISPPSFATQNPAPSVEGAFLYSS